MIKYKDSDGILGWDFDDYIPSDSEEFIKKLESFKKEREKQLPTVNIKKAIEDKDPGRILSGVASAIPMIGGSLICSAKLYILFLKPCQGFNSSCFVESTIGSSSTLVAPGKVFKSASSFSGDTYLIEPSVNLY